MECERRSSGREVRPTEGADYFAGHLTITKQAGVTYKVQSGATLLTGQPTSFSAATTTVLINNSATLKVRDNILIGTPPARLLRVKVTAAPGGGGRNDWSAVLRSRFASGSAGIMLLTAAASSIP